MATGNNMVSGRGATSKALVSYVLALTAYGTIGWIVYYIKLPTEVVVLCRGAIGACFISLVLLFSRKGIDRQAVRDNFKWLIASGLCLCLNWVFLFAAFRATTVASATLCNYMAPVIIVILAPVIMKEPRSAKKLICAGVALLGMVFVSGIPEGGAEGVTAKGCLLGLAAALCFVGIVILNKKMGKVPTYERAIIQLAFATIAALPFVLVNNWGVALHPDHLSLALVGLLGILHTGVAYCLYFYAFSILSTQTIAVLGYIEPGVSVVLSALLLHQHLSLLGWVGAILVIGAAALSEVIE